MAISATQLRRGMVIVFEGQPCKVMEFRHHTPGNLRAMVQAKLKNIRTGSTFEHRFRSVDTIDRASLEQHEMEYLYSDEGQLLWMKGYCHPIREADMRTRGVIPADLASKLPDVSGAVFPTLDQLNKAADLITKNWDSAVGADVKAAP